MTAYTCALLWAYVNNITIAVKYIFPFDQVFFLFARISFLIQANSMFFCLCASAVRFIFAHGLLFKTDELIILFIFSGIVSLSHHKQNCQFKHMSVQWILWQEGHGTTHVIFFTWNSHGRLFSIWLNSLHTNILLWFRDQRVGNIPR